MKKALAGEKQLLKNTEVVPLNIQACKAITVEYVLKLALKHKVIQKYLPDAADLESDNYIDKTYLFTLVNTLSPNFFDNCIEEYA